MPDSTDTLADEATAIAVDASRNVYVTVRSRTSVTAYFATGYAPINYSQASDFAGLTQLVGSLRPNCSGSEVVWKRTMPQPLSDLAHINLLT